MRLLLVRHRRLRRDGLRAACWGCSQHALICSLALVLLPGCAQPRRPLGDGTLSGKLPKKWEEQPVSGNKKVRVARMWIPDPWELHIYPAPPDADPQKEPGWKFVRNDKRKGGKTLVGDKQHEVVHSVWIYRGRVADMPLLEASVDTRLPKAQVERFLSSLRPAKE